MLLISSTLRNNPVTPYPSKNRHYHENVKVRLNKIYVSALTREYSLALGNFCAMVFCHRGSRRPTDISHVASHVQDQTFTIRLPVNCNNVYQGLFVVYLSTFSVTQTI
jgi:hypothetical protein